MLSHKKLQAEIWLSTVLALQLWRILYAQLLLSEKQQNSVRGVAVAPPLTCGTPQHAQQSCRAVQGIENKRTFELSEEELTSLRDEVEKYSVEGDLRRFNALNIKRLKDIQCYRGRRHIVVRCCLTPQSPSGLQRGFCEDCFARVLHARTESISDVLGSFS